MEKGRKFEDLFTIEEEKEDLSKNLEEKAKEIEELKEWSEKEAQNY